jgi:hypothetical protein
VKEFKEFKNEDRSFNNNKFDKSRGPRTNDRNDRRPPAKKFDNANASAAKKPFDKTAQPKAQDQKFNKVTSDKRPEFKRDAKSFDKPKDLNTNKNSNDKKNVQIPVKPQFTKNKTVSKNFRSNSASKSVAAAPVGFSQKVKSFFQKIFG